MPRKRKPAKKAAPPPKRGGGRAERGKGGHQRTPGLRSGALNLTRTNGPKKQVEDLKRALANADIISVNEVFKDDAALRWAKRNGYGVYMGHGKAADSAIIWDKREVQMVPGSAKSIALNKREGEAGGTRTRYAAYAQFEDRKSGNTFWQIAAHTVPMGKGNKQLRGKIRDEQYETLGKLAKELSATGPVLLAGDLNFQDPNIAGLESYGNGIMHVMSGNGLNAKNTERFKNFNSDHQFLVTSFRFDKNGAGVQGPAAPPSPEVPPTGEPLSIPGGIEEWRANHPVTPPTFTGQSQGDLAGGPIQNAPGAPAKANGSPVFAPAPAAPHYPPPTQQSVSWGQILSDYAAATGGAPAGWYSDGGPNTAPPPASPFPVRPDINLETAQKMMSKVSGGFYTGGLA